jgi:zinc protease
LKKLLKSLPFAHHIPYGSEQAIEVMSDVLISRAGQRKAGIMTAASSLPLSPAHVPPAHIQIVTASCGIEAWLVRSNFVPLVAMAFVWEGGAAQDTPGKSGTAQLMARLLDEGAGEWNSDQFQERLADRAIELSFSAGTDSLSGSLKTLTKHFDEGLNLLKLALTQPRFDTDAVERARAQTLAGLRHHAKDPDDMAQKRFLSVAYPNHPYGNPGSGTLESVSLITREDIVEAARRQLARSSLRLVVVGNIEEEELKDRIDSVFGDLPSDPVLKPVPHINIQSLDQRFLCDLDVPQSVIRFALPGLPRQDPDFLSLFVFNHILGGGSFTSRLFQEVREKRGLAYSIGTSLATRRASASLSGYTATKNAKVEECLTVITEQITQAVTENIPEEEIKSARDYLIGSWALGFDTSVKIASQLAHIAFEGLGVDYLARRNGLIAQISSSDIARVAQTVIGTQKPLVVIAGRPEADTPSP